LNMDENLEEILGQGYEIEPKSPEHTEFSVVDLVQEYAQPALKGIAIGFSISAVSGAGFKYLEFMGILPQTKMEMQYPFLGAIGASVTFIYRGL